MPMPTPLKMGQMSQILMAPLRVYWPMMISRQYMGTDPVMIKRKQGMRKAPPPFLKHRYGNLKTTLIKFYGLEDVAQIKIKTRPSDEALLNPNPCTFLKSLNFAQKIKRAERSDDLTLGFCSRNNTYVKFEIQVKKFRERKEVKISKQSKLNWSKNVNDFSVKRKAGKCEKISLAIFP